MMTREIGPFAGILLIVATLTSCDVDELVKNAINNGQRETIFEAPPGMTLGDNNSLYDSNGQALTDPSGNKVQVIHDTGGNLVKGRFNSYLVNQRDVYGNRLSNELLVNSRGEVWLDGNNNLVLAKRIPGPGSYDDATPSPVEEATTLTGLIKHPPSPPPVFFGAASGHYYRNQKHNLLAATNANNYVVLGGYPDHFYNGNNPLEKLDLNNNTLTLATNGYGIVTLDECHFNSVMIDSLFSTPPSLSDIVNSPELGCWPNNARQMAFNGYSFFSGVLTKTNELWGIGYAEHGLGGGLSTPISDLLKLTLPVKIADNVKSTTLHSTAGRYSYIGHILTNEGEVFEIGKKSSNKGGHATDTSMNHIDATSPLAANNGFTKLKVPANDLIINVVPKLSYLIRNKAVAIGASGQYYLLSEQSAQPIGLRFSQVTAILSLSDFQENGQRILSLSFINSKGKLSLMRLDNFAIEEFSGDYILTSNPGQQYPASQVTFTSVISLLGKFGLLKDAYGKYYAFIGDKTNAFLTLGNYVGQFVQLGDDLPVIQFLNANPEFEFLFSDPRILINRKDRQIAIIDTGGFRNNSSGINFYTEPPNSGNRAYGNVYILPTELTRRLWLEK